MSAILKGVPVDAYAFESALESAVTSWLDENNILDSKKQRSNENLLTPRVEIKAVCNGFVPRQYHVVQETKRAYLVRQRGQLLFRIVTHRTSDPADEHSRLRGAVRFLAQFWVEISAKMPKHILVEALESGTTLTIQQDKFQDVSAMSFDIVIDIRKEVFPTNLNP